MISVIKVVISSRQILRGGGGFRGTEDWDESYAKLGSSGMLGEGVWG